MHVDEKNEVLWVGHMVGKVSAFSIAADPNGSLGSRLLLQFQVRLHIDNHLIHSAKVIP